MIVHHELLPVCKFPGTSAVRHKPKEPASSLVPARQTNPGRRPIFGSIESASSVLQWRRMKLALAESRIANTAPVTTSSIAATGGRRISLPNSLAIPAAALLLAISGLLGCRHSGPPVENEGPDSLGLASSSIPGRRIPAAFTCDGTNTSPPLRWNTPPPATKAFALILNDRDAPLGSFVHWVMYDLPPATRSLNESVPALNQLPDGSRQGHNDFDNIGYGGPCPPGHKEHHYAFMLFALDTNLNLPAGATRTQLDDAMKGHVLARGELVASFRR